MEHVSTPIKTICYHCGEDCATDSWQKEEKTFCCQGCLAVYDLLESNDLCGYYDLEQNKGVSLKAKSFEPKPLDTSSYATFIKTALFKIVFLIKLI